MKTYMFHILILTIGLILFSCSEDDPNFPVPTPFSVKFETTNVIGPTGGTINIKIDAGNVGWWVETPVGITWVKIDRKFGAGDFILPVKVAPNSSGQSRTINIIINPTFDLEPIILTITQTE